MEVSSPTTPGTRLPIRYLLVLWLTVLSAVAYLDRTNISIAGIEIGKEFAIGNVRLGWIFSAFLIGYAGFQIPAGLLARRLGPRRVLGLLGERPRCIRRPPSSSSAGFRLRNAARPTASSLPA